MTGGLSHRLVSDVRPCLGDTVGARQSINRRRRGGPSFSGYMVHAAQRMSWSSMVGSSLPFPGCRAATRSRDARRAPNSRTPRSMAACASLREPDEARDDLPSHDGAGAAAKTTDAMKSGFAVVCGSKSTRSTIPSGTVHRSAGRSSEHARTPYRQCGFSHGFAVLRLRAQPRRVACIPMDRSISTRSSRTSRVRKVSWYRRAQGRPSQGVRSARPVRKSEQRSAKSSSRPRPSSDTRLVSVHTPRQDIRAHRRPARIHRSAARGACRTRHGLPAGSSR